MNIITADQLAAWTQQQILAADPVTVTVVEGVNAYVSTLPVAADLTVGVDGQVGGSGYEAVRLGTLMLASRVHRRRNSPNGIEAVTGDSIAYTARRDPDVARFLELDAPRVG